jgi:hypothetical protein
MNRLLNGLMTHLVALVFLLFLVVALWWRGPLFGIQGPPDARRSAPVATAAGSAPTPARVAPQQPVKPAAGTHRLRPVPDKSVTDAISDKPQPLAHASAPGRPTFRPLQADELEAAATAASRTPPTARKPGGRGAPFRSDPNRRHGISPRLAQAGPDELLRAAREAFWNKRYAQAETRYLRYLGMRPEDAAIFAELGNLYQSMHRRQDAMDAYYEAAVRFRARGENDLLRQLTAILRKAGDPRARSLTSGE